MFVGVTARTLGFNPATQVHISVEPNRSSPSNLNYTVFALRTLEVELSLLLAELAMAEYLRV